MVRPREKAKEGKSSDTPPSFGALKEDSIRQIEFLPRAGDTTVVKKGEGVPPSIKSRRSPWRPMKAGERRDLLGDSISPRIEWWMNTPPICLPI